MPASHASLAGFPRLLTEAQDGSVVALGKLLEKYRSYLYWLSNRRLDDDLQSKAGGSDFVQEAMVTALQRFTNFSGDSEEEFAAWLRGILANTFRAFTRSLRERGKRQVARERSLDGDLEVAAAAQSLASRVPSPIAALLKEERDRLVREAVALLSEEDQWLLHFETRRDLTWAQTGERLGISADAARLRSIEAIQRFGELLPLELFPREARPGGLRRRPGGVRTARTTDGI